MCDLQPTFHRRDSPKIGIVSPRCATANRTTTRDSHSASRRNSFPHHPHAVTLTRRNVLFGRVPLDLTRPARHGRHCWCWWYIVPGRMTTSSGPCSGDLGRLEHRCDLITTRATLALSNDVRPTARTCDTVGHVGVAPAVGGLYRPSTVGARHRLSLSVPYSRSALLIGKLSRTRKADSAHIKTGPAPGTITMRKA